MIVLCLYYIMSSFLHHLRKEVQLSFSGHVEILWPTCLQRPQDFFFFSNSLPPFVHFCFRQPYVFKSRGQLMKKSPSIISLTLASTIFSFSTKFSSPNTSNFFSLNDASQLQRGHKYKDGIW